MAFDSISSIPIFAISFYFKDIFIKHIIVKLLLSLNVLKSHLILLPIRLFLLRLDKIWSTYWDFPPAKKNIFGNDRAHEEYERVVRPALESSRNGNSPAELARLLYPRARRTTCWLDECERPWTNMFNFRGRKKLMSVECQLTAVKKSLKAFSLPRAEDGVESKPFCFD